MKRKPGIPPTGQLLALFRINWASAPTLITKAFPSPKLDTSNSGQLSHAFCHIFTGGVSLDLAPEYGLVKEPLVCLGTKAAFF